MPLCRPRCYLFAAMVVRFLPVCASVLFAAVIAVLIMTPLAWNLMGRPELPEGDLRAALYEATIEAVSVENDPNFPETPIRPRLMTGICTIGFDRKR